MLDVQYITSHSEEVRRNLDQRKKNVFHSDLDMIVKLDEKRKEIIQKVEKLKEERNNASHEIARRKKNGMGVDDILMNMKKVSDAIREFDNELVGVQKKLEETLLLLPNLLDTQVPFGEDSSHNTIIKTHGAPRVFPRDFVVQSHDEIGEKLGVLDFNQGGKVAGSRFVYLKGKASRLERVLINWMIHQHIKAGYQEISTPYLVNRASLIGTGQLPKFEDDVFRIEKYDYFLIPTAEVSVTNYHRDSILDEDSLPIKYVSYSPCFRSEAGSYGKDTKGLKRQHQFHKVELVHFSSPNSSQQSFEELLYQAEKILIALELPYRVVLLSSGDTGFSSSKTYDLEVWLPSIKNYMEISSCSNFLDFQARRAHIRYRDKKTQKLKYLHTLNGSALAVGRTLLAIMENYQTKEGDFDIPSCLQKMFLSHESE